MVNKELPARPSSGNPANGKSDLVEVLRLQDLLKQKEKLADDQAKEITVLRGNLSAAQRALVSKEAQASAAQERATNSQGDAASQSKELLQARSEKLKLGQQLKDQLRTISKLQEQVARSCEKNPGLAMQVAQLQSELRCAKADAEAAREESRAQTNLVRAKDKEMALRAKQVEAASALVIANGKLENQMLGVTKLLDEAKAENKVLAHVNRTREADIVKMTRDMAATGAALATCRSQFAESEAKLRAALDHITKLDAELGILRDEVTRTGAVAARVAASEVKDFKGEGTVSLSHHVEQIKYMSGENGRLKDKVAALEKEIAVSAQLKERYRSAAERMSISAIPSNAIKTTPGDITVRRRSYSTGPNIAAVTRSLMNSVRQSSASQTPPPAKASKLPAPQQDASPKEQRDVSRPTPVATPAREDDTVDSAVA
ncbi:hypothetical protein V8C86DRAFT_2530672 [Haematococcus lacustris]